MQRSRRETQIESPKFVSVMGAFLALVSAGIMPVHATCSSAGSNVSCSGAANPLAPSYANSGNHLNVTVNSGSSFGVLLGVGGTSMSLTGGGVTVTNNGTIDPATLDDGLGVLSSGPLVGNTSASTATVTSNGILKGSTGVSVNMQPLKAVTVSLGYDALINTGHASAQSGNVRVGYSF